MDYLVLFLVKINHYQMLSSKLLISKTESSSSITESSPENVSDKYCICFGSRDLGFFAHQHITV